jgi:hypothetical protein
MDSWESRRGNTIHTEPAITTTSGASKLTRRGAGGQRDGDRVCVGGWGVGGGREGERQRERERALTVQFPQALIQSNEDIVVVLTTLDLLVDLILQTLDLGGKVVDSNLRHQTRVG